MTKVNTSTKPAPSGDKPVKTERPAETGSGGSTETTKETPTGGGEKTVR